MRMIHRPVSYTHLDVYKRQAQDGAVLELDDQHPGDDREQEHGAPANEELPRLLPDVYKRQCS